MSKASSEGLTKSGARYILRGYLGLIMQAAILFVSAGHVNMLGAWIYVGTIVVHYTVSLAVLAKLAPELLNVREEKRFREGTKSWDKVLLAAYGIIGVYGLLAVAGLDVGRFHWSSLKSDFSAVASYSLFLQSLSTGQ